MLDPGSRTWWPALAVGAATAVATGAGLHLRDWVRPSGRVDLQLLLVQQLLNALGWVPRLGTTAGWALATVRALDAVAARPHLEAPAAVLVPAWSIVLFVAWDGSRWAVHRALHAIPALWAFHQVHHSAEVLTPLTFHRTHPVEAALYGLRGVLVTGTLAGAAFWAFDGAAVEWELAGVSALGLVCNVLTGNLRHSHVHLAFPAAVERWLLSPAQHQLHHGRDPAAQQANFGTWLAGWDRLAGTWRRSAPEPLPVGLDDPEHDPRDAVSALFSPFRRTALAALAAVGFAGRASAAEPADDEPVYEVIVDSDAAGVTHEAGSAYVLDEEALRRHSFDDIHRVVAAIPGVYVRGEDGFGLRPNIGMRGGNADRSAKITLLEDGVPLAPAPYASPAAYYFPMAMRFVGLEVFKGPSAVRFGPQTIGGTLNVRTRPVPSETSGAVDLDAGAFGTLSGHAWGALADERGGLLLESANLATQGFKTLPDGGPTGFVRQDVMAKTRLATGDTGAVELKLGYGRERSYETYLGLSADDADSEPYARYAASALDRMDWRRTQAELSWATAGRHGDARVVAWQHSLWRAWRKVNRFQDGPDLHDLLQSEGDGASAVFLEVLRGGLDSLGADQQLMIGTNDRTFHSGGLLAVAHHRASGRGWSHALEVGLAAELDEVRRLHTEDPFDLLAGRPIPVRDSETSVLLDSATEALALAPHLHEDLGLGPVHLQPGVRLEWVRTAAGTRASGPLEPVARAQVLPGLAAVARGWDAVDVFAGVHRGFSPVNPESEADARPETAWSSELGARLYPGRSHLELVGFWSDYQEITGACTLSGGCTPDQLDAQFNGGAATILGLEALAGQEVPLPADVTAGGQLAWTVTRATFDTGFSSEFPQWGVVEAGDAMPYVPAHQGSLQLYADHADAGGSLTARYRSSLRDVAGQGEVPDAELLPPQLLLDAAARAHLWGTVSATATVTNLTGTSVAESYRPFGARPTAPRTWLLGFRAGAW